MFEINNNQNKNLTHSLLKFCHDGENSVDPCTVT